MSGGEDSISYVGTTVNAQYRGVEVQYVYLNYDNDTTG
jgi:hypothetical protein